MLAQTTLTLVTQVTRVQTTLTVVLLEMTLQITHIMLETSPIKVLSVEIETLELLEMLEVPEVHQEQPQGTNTDSALVESVQITATHSPLVVKTRTTRTHLTHPSKEQLVQQWTSELTMLTSLLQKNLNLGV